MDQLLLRKVLKVLPLVTLIYSFWLLYISLGILHSTGQNYVYFLILTFQVYINWAAIVNVTSNCTSAKSSEQKEKQDINMVEVDILGYQDKMYHPSSRYRGDNDLYPVTKNDYSSVNYDFVSYSNYITDVNIQKVWYCRKCCLSCLSNCRHCPLCSKCIFERDHHCVFLGACISSQNMKYFIVLLLYTALVCMYVFNLVCVEMNLYEDVSRDTALILRHFLPISFAKWLAGREMSYNLLQIFILNTTASISLFCIVFGVYHLYLVLSGKLLRKLQRNTRNPTGLRNIIRNFTAIFGKCGMVNFIIPIGFAEIMMKKYF
ncbi:palmitoyltransferase ZDHHC22 [Anabrus simplex]|uniref:palmitoyltransferase ZDHHC22 n=1 Tax=Anabrus simplex TaxID=316456 RepID=UPI0035A2B149